MAEWASLGTLAREEALHTTALPEVFERIKEDIDAGTHVVKLLIEQGVDIKSEDGAEK